MKLLTLVVATLLALAPLHADEPALYPLWDDSRPLPAATDIPELKNVRFEVIKKWDQPRDGYTFLHGVGLCWHKGKLYASFGHNKGQENTVGEEAQYRVSSDDGKTWSDLQLIDAGDEENLAVSHGVFHSHEGTLWAFQGAYYNHMQKIHTRAYSLDEKTGTWKKHGTIIENGFWPMNQPVRLQNGNWIMPGLTGGPYAGDRVFPAAVAISHGDDFTKWDYVQIPAAKNITRMWGECALWLDGQRVFNLARYGGSTQALLAVSEDQGQTWSPSRVSNLSMAPSKPVTGVLSNGQRYLVSNSAQGIGGRRSPLTIAVSRPGENVFSKIYVIRRSLHPDQPGESAKRLSLSYPCAIEHNGKLYVGYSNNGGRRANLNSAELAVIPLAELTAD
ncbi:exo-alpha-sialidase [Gimesia chilikensis]|uniref:exo-alpha-sialidase n=1 Tax=Gimesia chilikensis TaxID=2605989 RepID=UPI003A8E5114